MTKEELFEMFDRYDACETLDTGETIQVIHWHDLKHIAEEIVKNCSIPDVVGQSEQFYCIDESYHKIDRCKQQCYDCKRRVESMQ